MIRLRKTARARRANGAARISNYASCSGYVVWMWKGGLRYFHGFVQKNRGFTACANCPLEDRFLPPINAASLSITSDATITISDITGTETVKNDVHFVAQSPLWASLMSTSRSGNQRLSFHEIGCGKTADELGNGCRMHLWYWQLKIRKRKGRTDG